MWCKRNPLHTGGLFHCYMLDRSIFDLRGDRLCLIRYSGWKIAEQLAKSWRYRSDATLYVI